MILWESACNDHAALPSADASGAPLQAVCEEHDGELNGAVRIRQVDEGGVHARAALHDKAHLVRWVTHLREAGHQMKSTLMRDTGANELGLKMFRDLTRVVVLFSPNRHSLLECFTIQSRVVQQGLHLDDDVSCVAGGLREEGACIRREPRQIAHVWQDLARQTHPFASRVVVLLPLQSSVFALGTHTVQQTKISTDWERKPLIQCGAVAQQATKTYCGTFAESSCRDPCLARMRLEGLLKRHMRCRHAEHARAPCNFQKALLAVVHAVLCLRICPGTKQACLAHQQHVTRSARIDANVQHSW